MHNFECWLFECTYTNDLTVIEYVDKFYNRMIVEKPIGILAEKKVSKSGKDIKSIDINSIKNKDVHEIGAE
ncbi:MAG: hypothetical protein PHE33_11720 [Bacteroidales bacterium]|nr:hypothetical protein [Bacteroidales bacterium]